MHKKCFLKICWKSNGITSSWHHMQVLLVLPALKSTDIIPKKCVKLQKTRASYCHLLIKGIGAINPSVNPENFRFLLFWYAVAIHMRIPKFECKNFENFNFWPIYGPQKWPISEKRPPPLSITGRRLWGVLISWGDSLFPRK